MRTQTLLETLFWCLFAVGLVAVVNLCAPDPVHSERTRNHLILTEGERTWK